MRKSLLAVSLAILSLLSLAPPVVAAAQWSVQISAFHDALAPHGRWVETRA